MKLRDYQQSIFEQVSKSNKDSVFQLDTGGGKTAIIAKLNQKPTINIAHRNMLIEQISRTLTHEKIDHQIIGNSQITKRCQLYQRNHGVKYAGDNYVGTIQSITSRHRLGRLDLDTSLPYQIIIDEAHHVADGNMWAKLAEIFPNARFIGCTATPCRLDGKGMHKQCGGLYDELIQAEQLKENSTLWLIGRGCLSDYEAYCPPSVPVDIPNIKNMSREFSTQELDKWAQARINKHVQGDIIKHYQKLADGLKTIVFCPTIDVADQLSQLMQKHGYKATYIASRLSFVENMRRIDAFRANEVDILCNVEMATEGFDLPDSECLIMLRPTASIVLHKQMIGRVLRPKAGKKAIIIDHVGNIPRNGMPDDKLEWTLFGTPKNKSEHCVPCDICNYVHNAYLKQCPKCGAENWLRSTDAEDARAVQIMMYDVGLVRRLRREIFEKDRQALAQKARIEAQERFENELIVNPPFYEYGNNAVGQLCSKLAKWFVENITQTDMPLYEINKLTTSHVSVDFWVSNFTIKDLKTQNPNKCERVLKKWLKSH